MAIPVNILIVDDSEESHIAIKAILSGPDYRILAARSGADALRILLEQELALLIVDVVMPDMSGFELVELVHARARTAMVPIMFVTAYAVEEELVHRGYRAGAVDYLTKPLTAEIVSAKVAVFAQLFRQRKELEARVDQAKELGVVELGLASQRRYRSLAEALPNIVWTARTDGAVDYFNRRWFEYTGISVERAGGSWSSAVHPDEVPASSAAWQRTLASGEIHQSECRLRRADGVYRWQSCRAVPELGEGGEIVAWLGSFTDIDDERRASAALAELESTLDAVLEAVLIFDPDDWRVLYVNQGASALLGYGQKELLAMRPVDFAVEYDAAGLRALLAPLLAGEQSTITIETTFRRRDTRMVPVEVSLELIRINGGRIVAIARDLTERGRARLERELLYRETVDALRARDEFLSIASHELRTPLSALQLQIEMLLEPPRRDPTAVLSPEQLHKKLEVAARQVDRLSRLISELLDASRITARRLSLDREHSDLAAIAREVIERFADDAAKVRCTVELDAPEPVSGNWDRLRVEQIVTNLLTNALKFAPGQPIEITVSQDGPNARLTMTDHGIGIAPEEVERFFQRFEHTVSTRTSGGLGLGLYIVRGIVEAHGGTIRVDSEPEVGSSFTIELPCEPGPEPTYDAEREPSEHTSAPR